MSKKARKRLILLIILLIAALLSAWGFTMKTVYYKVKSNKLDKGVRIVFISDLHNCFYGGTDQSALIDAVHESSPDIVIFGGIYLLFTYHLSLFISFGFLDQINQ